MKYKIKEGYICRKIGTGFTAVAMGEAMNDFNGMIRLNTVGAEIWKMLEAEACTEDTIVQNLLARCEGAGEERVRGDVKAFLEKIRFALDTEE